MSGLEIYSAKTELLFACEYNSVKHYAQQLHVFVSTLNRICKAHLKSSPKVIIYQRLINEAKRKLLYTKQNSEDIAYSLGFKDVGYFSRFFKQATGEAPGQFRKAHGYGVVLYTSSLARLNS